VATKKASSKTPTRIEITFIGGSFDGKELEFVYPTPEYLVMNLGRDLYRRVTSTQYKYQTDWSEYENTIDKDRIYK
jgi:hypothetical protein